MANNTLNFQQSNNNNMKKKSQKKPVKITRLPDNSAFAKLRIPTRKQLRTAARIPSIDKEQLLTSMVYSAHRIADALEGMNQRNQRFEKLAAGVLNLSIEFGNELPPRQAKAIRRLMADVYKS
jgi:hypothetical protein